MLNSIGDCGQLEERLMSAPAQAPAHSYTGAPLSPFLLFGPRIRPKHLLMLCRGGDYTSPCALSMSELICRPPSDSLTLLLEEITEIDLIIGCHAAQCRPPDRCQSTDDVPPLPCHTWHSDGPKWEMLLLLLSSPSPSIDDASSHRM